MNSYVKFPFGNFSIKQEAVLDTTTGAFDSQVVADPYIVQDGDLFYMFYWGLNGTNTEIGYATSYDQIHWTKSVSNPVLSYSAGEWDDYVVNKPVIIENGDQWYMYYIGATATDSGKVGLAIADSLNGIWTKYGSSPILSFGVEAVGDTSIDILTCSITKTGDTYYMYYSAQNKNDFVYRIYYATSTDGISWTKKGKVLDVGASGAFDDGWIGSGNIIKVGDYYIMAYNAGSTTPSAFDLEPSPSGIGLAYSTDLISWTKYSYPILETNNNRDKAKNIWRSFLTRYQNDYYLYFNAGDSDNIERIFVSKLDPPSNSFTKNLTVEDNLYTLGDSLNIGDGQLTMDSVHKHFIGGDYDYYVKNGYLEPDWGYQPVMSLYKASLSWWASFAIRTLIDSTVLANTSYPGATTLGLISEVNLDLKAPQNFTGSIRGAFGRVQPRLESGAQISSGPGEFGVYGLYGEIKPQAGDYGTYKYLTGVGSTVNGGTGSHGTVTNAIGVKSYIYKGASMTITNAYGMYSNIGSGLSNAFHFYTIGNYPSWFSGNVNAMGYNYATDGGSTDAYVITLKGAHTLSAGLEVTFKANTANTGAATLQVNSLTAKALTKATASGVNTALATGDIVAGQIIKAVYDGTQFQIISRLAQ